MAKDNELYMTDAQLNAEISRCEYCEEKPCKKACPADCSPPDFMMAAKLGEKGDFKRAAALILGNNPFGEVCGLVCPDTHCMKACSRKGFDRPVNIPAVQATVVRRARELGVAPQFEKPSLNGSKVAIIGAGPAGLAAAAALGQKGYAVEVQESESKSGGMCELIPGFRLERKALKADIEFVKSLGSIAIRYGKKVADPAKLRAQGYDAVLVSTGLDQPYKLGIKGEDGAVNAWAFLRNPGKYKVKGKRVVVVGGGAVAADCAEISIGAGAAHVEVFSLEKLSEMPLTQKELDGLMHAGVSLSGRTKIKAIAKKGKGFALKACKVDLAKGKPFHPANVAEIKGSDFTLDQIGLVVVAIGSRSSKKPEKADAKKGVFYAGDMENGPTTVVEAVAAGKNVALEIDAFVTGEKMPKVAKKVKSPLILPGRKLTPISLEADFFGRKIISPFLLSAAPPSDGYEQMKKGYEAGWAGGVMKTAFDGIHIHIPSQYMFAFNEKTYANCDNVSGHPLDRVCAEVEKLRTEFPDRLTIASTGGPVTGNDESDKRGWQANTKKLEGAGVMGIEYSLSCPQGGDGTKGDIVSQDAELTAKIIDWVMEVSDPEIPKLFKLTAAVTAIYPIITAIKEVFDRYPGKKAGVTLANTFPTLAFRKGSKSTWEEGVVVGMSGEGVTPISNLTLANVSKLGVSVSGNGGPMDYKAAAHFLALGAETVQFCTIAMKYGYGIIDELHSGVSHLMEERGIRSMKELIGRALPNPITGFMDLSPVKKISHADSKLCQHCGNCTRCPYLAITLDKKGVPITDPAKCIGCSICAQKCFSGAIKMRDRTDKEAEMLVEA
jgi:NADPH-dependent glutamate synthase beta subunit-like oxidoreductase/dihydroorotate dehydrogenase/Pyruvate/2-oxoacid:ferredoxin oxidoreductase delta subunit